MRLLKICNTDAIQINPNLGIILTGDMEGWFHEKYINIFMNGTIIDYVDNVNYSGAIIQQHVYSYEEIKQYGIIDVIEKEIALEHYIHLWVDEIAIPQSIRYKRDHFVHPLMIYGYNSTEQIIKAVFFDIARGQTFIDIQYQDLIFATKFLDQFYQFGGNDNAISQTLLACSLHQHMKGLFHIDVFAKQLSNYICCTTDNITEWYTTSRAGIYNSNDNIFGIQIYLQLIRFLQSVELQKDIQYKAIHDFIAHKKFLLRRFRYIQSKYNVSDEYNHLITLFDEICKTLEQVRLLNMKRQFQLGYMPATLCFETDYLCKLINTLSECYTKEMDIMPQIYSCIIKLTYSKSHCEMNNTICLAKTIKDDELGFVEFNIPELDLYTSRIDIIRCGEYNPTQKFEYILLNNKMKYYLEKDHFDHMPLRSLKIPTIKLRNLRIYTENHNCTYNLIVYPLKSELLDSTKYILDLKAEWSEYHHIIQMDSSATNRILLTIINEDPYMEKEGLYINADKFEYLHVRMSTTAKTIYAQIFFASVNSPYISVDKSLFFKIVPDGQMHDYYIKMTRNGKWHGIIKKIRLDPAQYHDIYLWEGNMNGVCEIECIEFLDKKPDYMDECMVADWLKDDGSTFKNCL